MKKIKILHLITHAAFGGSQDNTFCTCERHNRDRFEVHLACNPRGEWSDRARNSADVFHPIPALVTPISLWRDLAAFVQILRLMRRERFDLVHTHTAKAGFLGRITAWICRVPIIVHTYHAFPFHDFQPSWKQTLFLTLERLAQPMTDRFITLSKRQRVDACRFGMARPAHTRAIYTGIDFTRIESAQSVTSTRRQFGIPEGRKLVVTAARLDPAKAPGLLIDAFAQVVRDNPNTMLLVAGEGELRAELENQIEQLGLHDHVQLLGYRKDVPSLLAAADVFAFSSISEAMGRAMIEAMLLGRPVVVPAIHGIPEIVRHGETGYLYDVGNAAQLAEQIGMALNNEAERARIGANAQALTRRLFSVDQMLEQIEALYEQTLTSNNHPAHQRLQPNLAASEQETVPLERAA